ncbi:anti-sigma-I factor RsgI family protein [Oribacterium sinus]|uniref:anti-sigma-I factor RsgI family protein n=1 Tax=Oribacterium sinus TaxID=237576 RepID=UPI0028E61ECB|nr:PepSY domain-containing protein [Oribacterium sinus]
MSKMKQENMEKELQEAVQNLIPNNLFTRITAELDSKEEGAKMEKVLVRRIESKRSSLGLKTVMQLVAACVALVLVVGGIFYYRGNLMVDSLVDLDVNPGIELLTNQKNRVLEAYATNGDGDKVLSGMDLHNVDLQVALNAIVGSMVQQGYMTKDTKGVLVTVQNKDQKKAETLRKLVVKEMEIALSTEDMNAAVFHQVISIQNNNASAFARKNNISLGKAVFVLNLANKARSLDAKELAKMKISEIAKLVADKNIDIRDIIEYDSDDSLWENIADAIEDINEGDDDYIVATTQQESTQAVQVQPTETQASVQTQAKSQAQTQPQTHAQTKPQTKVQTNAQPQTSGRISADKAKAIAFGHAGVSAGQVRELSVEYDDDGVYEIDFKVGNTEYDYEIGATDGSIRKADVEQDD